MEKGFEVLRGTRVLLNAPELKTSNLELDEATEDQLRQEYASNLGSLEVYAVGDAVEDVTQGDHVYIHSFALQNAEKMRVNDEVKFLINERDIAIIW